MYNISASVSVSVTRTSCTCFVGQGNSCFFVPDSTSSWGDAQVRFNALTLTTPAIMWPLFSTFLALLALCYYQEILGTGYKESVTLFFKISPIHILRIHLFSLRWVRSLYFVIHLSDRCSSLKLRLKIALIVI